jgi:hypothetical protein
LACGFWLSDTTDAVIRDSIHGVEEVIRAKIVTPAAAIHQTAYFMTWKGRILGAMSLFSRYIIFLFGNNLMSQPAIPLPATITREKLSEMIEHLRPDRELFAGRKFFERLIEYKSVEEVIAFVNKATAALDKQDGLDLYFDFDPVEKEVFARTRLRVMSRREFLGVSAVGIAGGVERGVGLEGEFDVLVATKPEAMPLAEAMARGAGLIEESVVQLADVLREW